jgi:hypothetical protein
MEGVTFIIIKDLYIFIKKHIEIREMYKGVK